ncbi:cation-transporting P-type ATPase [Nonomuraea sp. NPDC050786]|uniref:P-type ATPase n=1 Tax=Nonomuraea sp. NPDC050786 TaxID=3154840 RepID=UPI0033CD7821
MDATMDALTGLSDAEAVRLLADHGRNELPEPRRPSLPRRAARLLADPLSILLLLAGLVTLVVLGEVPEGAAILAILVVNVVIGVSQEVRADQAVRALRTLTAPMAKVRRGGVVRRIPAGEVVPGDVVEVAAGDRVPADARVVEASSVAIAAVPESMAAAVTTALALGSQRMARLGVIVRRLSAIQALGATTVIASEKTGTLTTGRLTVADHVEIAGADLWRAAVRCNDARDGLGDAVDVALLAASADHGIRPDDPRLATRPFDAGTRSMAVVTEGPVLTVKGAPEVVLARCVPCGGHRSAG